MEMLNLLADAPFYMPPEASTVAGDVDWLFNIITTVTVFFSLLIFVLMLWFSVRYRHRPGKQGGASPGHSTALELTWTIIPVIIVLVIFFFGFRGYLDMQVTPPDAYEINVGTKMWNFD